MLEQKEFKSKFIFDNAADFDFTAQYPNLIAVFDIMNDGQYGKMMVLSKTKVSGVMKHVPAVDIVNSIISNNKIHTAKTYFNLPDVDDMIKVIENKPDKYLK